MLKTFEPFVAVGDLWLRCQEGGFASDAFVLQEFVPEGIKERIGRIVTNLHRGDQELDDMVAEHFGIERDMPSGDRHVGTVRITIEFWGDEPIGPLRPQREGE